MTEDDPTGKKTTQPGRRGLTPRQALRLFHAPLEHRATRRQMLGGMLGTAALGCSGDKSSRADDAPDTTQGQDPPAAEAAESTAAPDPTVEEAATSPTPSPPAESASPQATSAEPEASNSAAPAPGEAQSPPEQPELPPQAEATPEPTASVEATAEPEAEPPQPSTMGRSAYDLVELGNTGIVTSRLAMGSGTTGYNGSSAQTRMGDEFVRLLVGGYDRGIRLFETADAYGTHSLVGSAMQQVGRQNVTLLTKTMAETRQEAEADLERFMEELGTDYIDIVLLHIRTSPNWVEESAGAMEVLAEAKARGQIRAHGVSCHSLAALELAAQTDWVDIDLARINPFGLHMDSDPSTVINVLESMKSSGKGVLGMKILAQGDAVGNFDEAIEHATRLECIHGFTIGFTSSDQLDQVATKIQSV